MFIKDGKRFNPYATHEFDGVVYRGNILKFPAVVASLGITEIPEPDVPVDYDPDLYFRTEQDDAPYVVYTKKSQEQIDAILAKRAEIEAENAARAELKQDAFVQQFIAMTPADVRSYVDANVTDLASAKALLRRMAVMLLLLAKAEYKPDEDIGNVV